jgi:hypothetical protein
VWVCDLASFRYAIAVLFSQTITPVMDSAESPTASVYRTIGAVTRATTAALSSAAETKAMTTAGC